MIHEPRTVIRYRPDGWYFNVIFKDGEVSLIDAVYDIDQATIFDPNVMAYYQPNNSGPVVKVYPGKTAMRIFAIYARRFFRRSDIEILFLEADQKIRMN